MSCSTEQFYFIDLAAKLIFWGYLLKRFIFFLLYFYFSFKRFNTLYLLYMPDENNDHLLVKYNLDFCFLRLLSQSKLQN